MIKISKKQCCGIHKVKPEVPILAQSHLGYQKDIAECGTRGQGLKAHLLVEIIHHRDSHKESVITPSK